MTKGPVSNFENTDLYLPLDMCFRLIVVYLSTHDQNATRLDIKIGNEQYHTVFVSGTPIEPQAGDRILPENDLITPKNNIIDCINLKVNKHELIRGLKEIIGHIEEHIQNGKR